MKHYDFLKHRLLLFLSCDMAGSTAFKQGQESLEALDENPGPRWAPAFALFYSTMTFAIAAEWKLIARKHPKIAGDCPRFWKVSGDEVLYFKEITEYRQALFCVHAWIKAVQESRRLFKRFKDLDLKATAWVANFPIPNIPVVLDLSRVGRTRQHSVPSAAIPKPENIGKALNDFYKDWLVENLNRLEKYYKYYDQRDKRNPGNFLLDFMGPSMDTGFRLAQRATSRKVIISIGLAWMIAEALRERALRRRYRDLVVYYDGGKTFKGLLSGGRYPVFWIDMMPGDRKRVFWVFSG